ncbi:transposase [Streptomyces sp. LN500]|uniref:transposase n=1 Tax=Streptomyces sp. LN500 TaxID=3112978 RepID=UPI003713DF5B
MLDELGARARWTGPRRSSTRPPFAPKRGGSLTGPNPVDRGKKGSKLHVLSDAQGIPHAVAVSGANIHDSLALKPLIRGIPAVSSRAPSAMAGRRRGCGSRPPAPVDHFHKL